MPRYQTLIGATLLVFLFVPVGAQAEPGDITMEGAPLTEPVVETASGVGRFESESGGLECPISQTVTLEPGSTGTTFETGIVETSKCTFYGHLDNLCGSVTDHAGTGLPWVGHSGGSGNVLVTEVHIDFGGSGIFCPDVTLNGSITGVPDNANAISFFTVEGFLGSNLGHPVLVSGTVNVENPKTYGVDT